MQSRAYLLAPGAVISSTNYGQMLLSYGRLEDVRALAGSLLIGSPGQALAGEALMLGVERDEARFAAALERARRVIPTMRECGSVSSGGTFLAMAALEVASIVGQSAPLADEMVRAFVDPDPPRLHYGHLAAFFTTTICGLASRPAAQRCFARLHALIKAGHFRQGLATDTMSFLEGAERYVQGDFKAAARLWRPLAKMPQLWPVIILADGLDRGGEVESAETADASEIDRPGRKSASSRRCSSRPTCGQAGRLDPRSRARQSRGRRLGSGRHAGARARRDACDHRASTRGLSALTGSGRRLSVAGCTSRSSDNEMVAQSPVGYTADRSWATR